MVKYNLSRYLDFYLNLGWSVFPLHTLIGEECSCGNTTCFSKGKHPVFAGGVKNSSSDKNVVANMKWSTNNIVYNVGVATGTKSNLTVLDIDYLSGGLGSLDKYENTLKRDFNSPNFLKVKTPNGLHIYYKDKHIKNSVGKLGPGLDIRGEGGYVVAPPSVGYVWGYNIFKEDIIIEEFPLEILTILIKNNPTNNIDFQKGYISEGTRNDYLASICGKLLRANIKDQVLTDMILSINNYMCKPPLHEKEVFTIINSINSYYEEDIEPKTILTKLNWKNPPKDPSWLLEGLIADEDVVLLIGEPEAQKSWIALSLATSIVKEEKTWCDINLNTGGHVVYIDEENNSSEVWRRLKRLGFNESSEGDKLHYYSQQQIRLDKSPKKLFNVIEQIKPKLIILDSLIRFHTEDEGSNTAMSKLWNNGIMPLSRQHGSTVLVLHHVTKSNDNSGNSFRRARGAGDITAAPDLGLDIRIPDNGDYRILKVFKPRHPVHFKYLYLRVEDIENLTTIKRLVSGKEGNLPF